jgi:hypothetical protein
MDWTSQRAQWAADGTITIGGTSTGQSNVTIASDAVKLRTGTTDKITLDTSGTILVGSAAASNSNVFVSSGAVYLRTATTNKIALDTSGNITLSGDLTVSSPGNIYAGGGDVTIDENGISLATGSGGTNRYKFSDGSYFGSVTGVTAINSAQSAIELATSSYYVQIQNDGDFVGSGTGLVDLGESGVPWNDLYVTKIYNNPDDTVADDNPVVYSATNGYLYEKTDGASDSALGSCATGIYSMNVESGLVISVACTDTAMVVTRIEFEELKRELAELRALLAERKE